MSDTEAVISSFLEKLGWDLTAAAQRVKDVLKNKKLSATVAYLAKEVRRCLNSEVEM